MVFSGTSTFSSLTPLASPFWSSSSDPKCGAVVVDPVTNIQHCCDGLLIDRTQPITGAEANQHPYYFENLRCCSGARLTVADVTTCDSAAQVTLTEQLSTTTISGSTTVVPVTVSSATDQPITATEIIATAGPPSGSSSISASSEDPIGHQSNKASMLWRRQTILLVVLVALAVCGETLFDT